MVALSFQVPTTKPHGESFSYQNKLQNVRCFICQELTGSSHTKEYTTENVRCLLSYDLQFPKNYQI